MLLVTVFGCDRVYLFGSLAGWGAAPFGSHSDVDLAATGLAPEQYWSGLARIEAEFPPGTRVDLVPLESAAPSLVARIMAEGEVLADGAEVRGPSR